MVHNWDFKITFFNLILTSKGSGISWNLAEVTNDVPSVHSMRHMSAWFSGIPRVF